jgi:undecaprenyl-diphosphatase
MSKKTSFTQILKSRFRRDSFYGLTLTTLILIFSYISLLLAGLVEDVVTRDSIVQLDQQIAHYFEKHRTPKGIEFFLFFTFLGQPFLLIWGFLLSVIGLFWTGLTNWIKPLFASTFTSLLLVFLGKDLIQRPRPADPVYPMDSFSFPSGHSTIAVSFYGFIGLIFFIESHRFRTRLIAFITTLTLVSLILFSRLYLGVHYLSDIEGGLLVGTLSAMLGLGLYLRDNLKQPHPTLTHHPSEKNYNRQKIALLLLLFLLAWLGYEAFGEPAFYQGK